MEMKENQLVPVLLCSLPCASEVKKKVHAGTEQEESPYLMKGSKCNVDAA